MAIDRAFRSALALAIGQFLDGEIDNWALDDVCTLKKSDDRLCRELAFHTWLFYDDVRRYKNLGSAALTADRTEVLRRWEQLLRSEIEWATISPPKSDSLWGRIREFLYWRSDPKNRWRQNPYWPLPDAASWNSVIGEGRKQPPTD